MVNLKNFSILVLMMCYLFLLSQSSERKRIRNVKGKKWNITPYIGLEGILRFYGKNIKFMIEDISEKNTKYKYLVSYPNGEYQNNHIGLDFYNKKYTSQSIIGKGIIIDIQHYELNIYDNSEDEKKNEITENEDEEYFSSRENDMKENIKTNKNCFSGLQTLTDIDLEKWKIIPYIKMKGIYRYYEHEIPFVIEKIHQQADYKYFVSYPDDDYSKEWLKLNFTKKKHLTKCGEKYDIVKIYDPQIERKHKKPIKNFNENIILPPSTGGMLLPNPKGTISKETKIQFSIIRVERNPQFLKNEPNKIFWVNYPYRNITDEYIAINCKNLTYSHSDHFGEGRVQLRKKINENYDLYWSE